MARTSLQAVADSTDVCQSALATFLIHMAAGDYDLANKQSMENLLFTIARRKLVALTRREAAAKRNRFLTNHNGAAIARVAENSQADPGRKAMNADLLDAVDRRLTSTDRELFRRRRQGHSWDRIAHHMQLSSTVLRQRLSRTLCVASLSKSAWTMND